ncbi:type II toxin-antitoxin system RelE/ParE family toxin [Novosphingobium naphthalenivorans]|uniref:type II toxin-antitoxin system RelE/ParE family toxin n=1 Tax=Novosphingobium naphthalenivorans TaxID=273168 RepID=UPI00082F3B27|nr:type II toxin-antitoxin system RelE/ParE family toxin [Novosphingobium naphthalenivorans]
MTAKPVVPRAKAREDIDHAIEHYINEAGTDVAIGFIDALEQAHAYIGETPAAGSPRWSHELNLPGLRSIRLKGFPWLVFYLEFETHVDAWRVLHARRDIPAWMSDAEDK